MGETVELVEGEEVVFWCIFCFQEKMAAAKTLYNRTYDLDGRKGKEKDRDSGEMKENPWHKHCKKYAEQHHVSYAAAISLAGPSWKAYKEKNGLSFRERSKGSSTYPKQQQQEDESMEEGEIEEGKKKQGGKPLPLPKERRKRGASSSTKEKMRKGNKRGREEDYYYDSPEEGGRSKSRMRGRGGRKREEPAYGYSDEEDSRMEYPSSYSRGRGPPPQKRQRRGSSASKGGAKKGGEGKPYKDFDEGERYRSEEEYDEEGGRDEYVGGRNRY